MTNPKRVNWTRYSVSGLVLTVSLLPRGRWISILALVARRWLVTQLAAATLICMLIAACGGTTSGGGNPRQWTAQLREQAPNERAQAFVTALAVEPLRREPDEKYADALLAQVGQLAVSREITSVKARLQRMNPVEEQAGYNRMFGDLVGLEKRRKALLDRAAGA